MKVEKREDWIRDLQISMYRTSQSHTKQELIISITDVNDPLFLYTIDLSEPEFHILKEEQKLHIDFQVFPQKFYEMLDLCVNSKEELNKSTIGSYTCVLHMIQPDALLIIQETTQMRELNHLIVKMKTASDNNLKKYLSSLILDYKGRCEDLTKDKNRLNESLDSAKMISKAYEDELSTIKLTQ